ncbi:unnamed protein product [Nippostrongylus brasiliensis]|uniref:BPTI/Kunitz inhibitor domain-containing protein n=1 Tax=Nippostrongylus brasiliensis TaxID=27835 RepID=A0A0N4XGZ2_NIPBR|nr:unnamed protein product [Nippostrongylus brasiliensis]
MLFVYSLILSTIFALSIAQRDLVYACESLICDPPKMCIIQEQVAQCLLVLAPTAGPAVPRRNERITSVITAPPITNPPEPKPAQSPTPAKTEVEPGLLPETTTGTHNWPCATLKVIRREEVHTTTTEKRRRAPHIGVVTMTPSTTPSPLAPLLNLLGGGAPPLSLPTLPPPPTTTTVPPVDICSLPPLTGTCKQARIMWYYDNETGMCERFSFSGCGNLNRFPSKIQCERMCLRRG